MIVDPVYGDSKALLQGFIWQRNTSVYQAAWTNLSQHLAVAGYTMPRKLLAN